MSAGARGLGWADAEGPRPTLQAWRGGLQVHRPSGARKNSAPGPGGSQEVVTRGK